jgi:hypothetical protein
MLELGNDISRQAPLQNPPFQKSLGSSLQSFRVVTQSVNHYDWLTTNFSAVKRDEFYLLPSPLRTNQQFTKAIYEGWEDIRQDVINSLVKSIDTRVNAVLKSQDQGMVH